MSGASRTGTLILSVDLELDQGHQDGEEYEHLDQIRRRLVEQMRTHSLPATWAVADPALSVATESILAANSQHEIAVLGDQAWLGPGCGRMRMDRELTRRFEGARKAGIPATTLALRNLEQVRDMDLLLDHRITALRGPAVESIVLARKLNSPPIRYGIWQAPPGWKVPPHAAWWTPGSWSICREIKRAIVRQSYLHLAIDAPRLLKSSERDLAIIGKVLRYAAARREAGQLAIETIGQIAARLLAERAAAPSRSILRPAA
jgi:hypothetical protein